MPKALFICDIFNENGEKTQSEFVFDDITTDTAQNLENLHQEESKNAHIFGYMRACRCTINHNNLKDR